MHCNVDPLRTPSWPAIHNNEEDCLQDILRLFELNEFYLQINKTPLHIQQHHPSDGSSPLVEQNKAPLLRSVFAEQSHSRLCSVIVVVGVGHFLAPSSLVVVLVLGACSPGESSGNLFPLRQLRRS